MARQMLNKVPQVTLYFWIIKVLCTTVGETAADFLAADLGLGLTGTTAVMTILLGVALLVQLKRRRYEPLVYWVVVVLLSIVGTLVTDNLVDNLHISLEATTIAFAALLAVTFLMWYRSEKTLSIRVIHTTRREVFYWMAILFTFSLGTAAGDFLAEGLALGYGKSVLLFAGMIAVIAAAHFRFGLNAVLAFWTAYVITRPLGASLGDLLSQPGEKGGLGAGPVMTSVLFLAIIAGFIVYLRRHPETEELAVSSIQ